MTRIAVYPGSFDPPTLGHVNIVERATGLFDEVVVGVLINPAKKPMFEPAARVEMMREATAHLGGVRVEQFQGLLVDFARERGASVVLRGLRAVADFEYEFQMAMMNRRLAPAVDTLYLMTEAEVFHISSRFVREVAALGGDVSHAVPPVVLRYLQERGSRNEVQT
jgi:pantetheine-phosphate adenylyltransferase